MKKLFLSIFLISLIGVVFAQERKKSIADSLLIKNTQKDVKDTQRGMPIVKLDTSSAKYKTPVKITDTSRLSKMPGTEPLDSGAKLIPESKYSIFRDTAQAKELKLQLDSLKKRR